MIDIEKLNNIKTAGIVFTKAPAVKIIVHSIISDKFFKCQINSLRVLQYGDRNHIIIRIFLNNSFRNLFSNDIYDIVNP
jgi:hypothetical protein